MNAWIVLAIVVGWIALGLAVAFVVGGAGLIDRKPGRGR